MIPKIQSLRVQDSSPLKSPCKSPPKSPKTLLPLSPTFDPFLIPPNLKFCLKHLKAQRVGTPRGLKTCPCCHEKTKVWPFHFFANYKEMGAIGAGISLQFKFNMAMLGNLLVLFLGTGIYNLSLNFSYSEDSPCGVHEEYLI
jgi:hypothetical protein